MLYRAACGFPLVNITADIIFTNIMARIPFSQEWDFQSLLEWASHPVKKNKLPHYILEQTPLGDQPKLPADEAALVELIFKCSYIWDVEPRKDPYKVVGNTYIQKYIRGSLNKKFQNDTLEAVRRFTCKPIPFDSDEHDDPFSKSKPSITPEEYFYQYLNMENNSKVSSSTTSYSNTITDLEELTKDESRLNEETKNSSSTELMHRNFDARKANAGAPVYGSLLRDRLEPEKQSLIQEGQSKNLLIAPTNALTGTGNINHSHCWGQYQGVIVPAPQQSVLCQDYGCPFYPDYFGWINNYSSEFTFPRAMFEEDPFSTGYNSAYKITIEKAKAGLKLFKQDYGIIDSSVKSPVADANEPEPAEKDHDQTVQTVAVLPSSSSETCHPTKITSASSHKEIIPSLPAPSTSTPTNLKSKTKSKKSRNNSRSAWTSVASEVKKTLQVPPPLPSLEVFPALPPPSVSVNKSKCCSPPQSFSHAVAVRKIPSLMGLQISTPDRPIPTLSAAAVTKAGLGRGPKSQTRIKPSEKICLLPEIPLKPSKKLISLEPRKINNREKSTPSVLKLVSTKNHEKPTEVVHENIGITTRIIEKLPEVHMSTPVLDINLRKFAHEWSDTHDQTLFMRSDGSIGIHPVSELSRI